MMKCDDVRTLVDAWERGEDDTLRASWDEFAAHLGACDRCAREFGALLPLMERDAGAVSVSAGADAAAIESAPVAAVDSSPMPWGFAARVMDAVADEAGGWRGHGAKRSAGWRIVPALAAAAALFIVGIGVGTGLGARGANVARVTFMLYAPEASSVQLAGDFSSWNPGDFTLKKVGAAGMWEVQVPLQRGKVYVYNFVIDGTTWITDPKASGVVDDGFGGSSSLLRL